MVAYILEPTLEQIIKLNNIFIDNPREYPIFCVKIMERKQMTDMTKYKNVSSERNILYFRKVV